MRNPRFNLRSNPQKVRRYGISARTHEGAAVVSGGHKVEYANPVEGALMVGWCREALESLCSCVLESDGLVGHIKAVIEAQGHSVTLSTTGGEVNERPSEGWDGLRSNRYVVSVAAIAFTNPIELERRLIAALDLLNGLGG